MNTVKIVVGDKVELKAELYDNLTAHSFFDILPVEGLCNNWGDEFYFEIPLYMPTDSTSTTDVDIGDIAFWPPGKAFVIFFGPTPLSKDDGKPVPASEVNPLGRIIGDAAVLRKYKDETGIRVEKA